MDQMTTIKCFLAAARTGSFSAAAEELYMSRQAVSKQILKLEQALGVNLFVRATKRVVLTPAGELFRTFFLDELERFHGVCQQAAALTAKDHTIRIGYLSGIELGDLLYEITQQYQEPLPRLQWKRGNPLDLVQDVRSGGLDIGITFTDKSTRLISGIQVTPIGMIRMVVAVSRRNPGVREGATAKDFESETFYAWSKHPEDVENERQDVIRHGQMLGLNIQNVSLLESPETVKTVMEMGNGVALCTELDNICSSPRIITYPLDARIELGCVYRSDSGSEIQQFARHLSGIPL